MDFFGKPQEEPDNKCFLSAEFGGILLMSKEAS